MIGLLKMPASRSSQLNACSNDRTCVLTNRTVVMSLAIACAFETASALGDVLCAKHEPLSNAMSKAAVRRGCDVGLVCMIDLCVHEKKVHEKGIADSFVYRLYEPDSSGSYSGLNKPISIIWNDRLFMVPKCIPSSKSAKKTLIDRRNTPDLLKDTHLWVSCCIDKVLVERFFIEKPDPLEIGLVFRSLNRQTSRFDRLLIGRSLFNRRLLCHQRCC